MTENGEPAISLEQRQEEKVKEISRQTAEKLKFLSSNMDMLSKIKRVKELINEQN